MRVRRAERPQAWTLSLVLIPGSRPHQGSEGLSLRRKSSGRLYAPGRTVGGLSRALVGSATLGLTH